MSRMSWLQSASARWICLAGALFVVGVLTGSLVRSEKLVSTLFGDASATTGNPETQPENHAHEAGERAEEGLPIFDVTEAARQTIGLEIGQPVMGDYQQRVSLPAIVRERPAVSNLQAASKLAGIVTKIYVSIGQSVREGDPLFELELTGETLAEAQSTLLDASKRLEIVRQEIQRIRPVASAGGLARKNLLEKEYEERRLLATIDTKQQELLLRGFSAKQLESIVADGRLVRTHTIRVPVGLQPKGATPTERLSLTAESQEQERPVVSLSDDPWVYSIEKVFVNPGSMVEAGEPLCDLAYHEILLLEGQAYERDLPVLNHLFQAGQGLTIEMGTDDNPEFYDDVSILYLDNHIDPESQTVRVFLELQNVVTSEISDPSGALFRTWKYRPSQRGHVLLPDKQWEDKLVLPSDAVAEDGLDRVVFKHLGYHEPADEAAHHEFTPVPVSVLFQDRRHSVVEAGKELQAEDQIALNQAYLLLLQMNKGDGGGGHHHHDH